MLVQQCIAGARRGLMARNLLASALSAEFRCRGPAFACGKKFIDEKNRDESPPPSFFSLSLSRTQSCRKSRLREIGQMQRRAVPRRRILETERIALDPPSPAPLCIEQASWERKIKIPRNFPIQFNFRNSQHSLNKSKNEREREQKRGAMYRKHSLFPCTALTRLVPATRSPD